MTEVFMATAFVALGAVVYLALDLIYTWKNRKR